MDTPLASKRLAQLTSKEDAEEFVDKMWYEIYNQFNMDW